MGLRFRSKPHPAKDLTPGQPQNFVANAVSSTVFTLTWEQDPNKTLPDDFDLDFSLVSAAGPWTPVPVNLVYTYNHTGQDVTAQHWWRLVAKHAGFASPSAITTDIAFRPVFTVAPPSATIPAAGGTIQFTATDVDDPPLTYSLAFKYRNDISIDPTTGLVTVPPAASGTSGNIIVRATDAIGLYREATCAVTVIYAGTATHIVSVTGTTSKTVSVTQVSNGTVTTYSSTGNAIVTLVGSALNIGAGSVVEFRSGTYPPLELSAFRGTSDTLAGRVLVRVRESDVAPAVVRRLNPSSGGFVFQVSNNCKYLTINGYNPNLGSELVAPYFCGIKVTYAQNAVYAVGLTATKDGPSGWIKYGSRPQWVTLQYVEVDGGFTYEPQIGGYGKGYSYEGIGLQGHLNTDAAAANAWNEGNKYLYNYIHNVNGEGFYIGPNYPSSNLTGAPAPAATIMPLRNIEVAYNRVEDTGGGAMQGKCWFEGNNSMHHNIVKRCGNNAPTPQRAGIVVGGGPCSIYNNWVEDEAYISQDRNDPAVGGNPYGVQWHTNNGPPRDTLVFGHYGPYSDPIDGYIYNNVIFNTGNSYLNSAGLAWPDGGTGLTKSVSAQPSHSIQIGGDAGTTVELFRPYVFNNTCVNASQNGMSVTYGVSGSFIRNNISVVNVGSDISAPGTVNVAYNTTGDSTAIFVDYAADNFHLVNEIAATGVVGTDIAQRDYDNVVRPQGPTSSRGAYEKA